VYWLCVIFVVGTGLRGVTAGVFFEDVPADPEFAPAAAPDGGSADAMPRLGCADGAVALRRALDDEAAAVVAGEHDERALLSALAAYDARARAHAASCVAPGQQAIVATLARYRYAQERALLRHLREASPLAAELESLARAETGSRPPSFPGRPR
jgi:hypothetical protein